MAGLYIKLDYDWIRDPKVRNFRKQCGKAALVDLVQLYILMGRNNGRVDLKDYGQLADAMDTLGMKESKMTGFLDSAAGCGLIDRELWETLRVVTSNRAVRDASRRASRAEAGAAGGVASGASRRSKNEASASQANARSA